MTPEEFNFLKSQIKRDLLAVLRECVWKGDADNVDAASIGEILHLSVNNIDYIGSPVNCFRVLFDHDYITLNGSLSARDPNIIEPIETYFQKLGLIR